MVARIATVAFQGIDVRNIDVQVQISNGLPAFQIVGLADKAVTESRERVRAALHSLGLSLPSKRITVNLSPADLQKEGSHYDLPIALGVLTAMEAMPSDFMSDFFAMGELALDGSLPAVSGVLPAAINALQHGKGLICPAACGQEAVWAGDGLDIIAPPHLLALLNHIKGTQVLKRPLPQAQDKNQTAFPDLADVKGQESAKRALEIAAAGGHNMLMVGPPGSGKSMLAARLPGILPPLTPHQALESSMIHSISGTLEDNKLLRYAPFRDPHHSASLPALVGGGHRVKPGEISLAHHGVLFLDELPEFSRQTLEALRQPLETGKTLISRANHHVTYPARFQLIAAMNPCRCGYLTDPAKACNKAPICGQDYAGKLSGPLLDRIDLRIEVPAVSIKDLSQTDTDKSTERSAAVAARVAAARARQQERFHNSGISLNAHATGEVLETTMPIDTECRTLLNNAAERLGLSARSYHRIIRVARTIADLAANDTITRTHMSEALSYRAR